jgi:hypothetical protein
MSHVACDCSEVPSALALDASGTTAAIGSSSGFVHVLYSGDALPSGGNSLQPIATTDVDSGAVICSLRSEHNAQFSPGADVAGVSPVLAQMWEGCAQS